MSKHHKFRSETAQHSCNNADVVAKLRGSLLALGVVGDARRGFVDGTGDILAHNLEPTKFVIIRILHNFKFDLIG